MRFVMRVISTVNGLLEIENRWNDFVRDYVESPFLLSGFTKEFIKVNQKEGWTPLLLVFSVDNAIIGIAPLAIKTKFGIRLAKSLLVPALFPDFVLTARYRTMCIDKIFEFLFKRLKCQFVALTFLRESPNLKSLKGQRNLQVFEMPAMGHSVIYVNCDWGEFEKSQGRNFRRFSRRAERKLDQLGTWKVCRLNKDTQENDALERILEIERASWKEELRVKQNIEQDSDLISVWKGALCTTEIEKDFEWCVRLLELNGLPIAYVLSLKYKDIAYYTKTSYDRRYRRIFPGIYVGSVVIRDFFEKGGIRKIDFHTDLPFHKRWTKDCGPRVHVIISKHQILPRLLRFAVSNRRLKAILSLVSNLVSIVKDLLLQPESRINGNQRSSA